MNKKDYIKKFKTNIYEFNPLYESLHANNRSIKLLYNSTFILNDLFYLAT